jgi:hypothetical protein
LFQGRYEPFLIVVMIADTVKEERHVQYTERAVNEPGETEQVPLGEYDDVAPLTQTEIAPATTTFSGDHNLISYDFNGMLEREYLMDTITWTTGQARGTFMMGDPGEGIGNSTVSGLMFPKILLDIPFISEKTEDFRYIRAGLRVSFRVTSSKFSYGAMYIAAVPFASAVPKFNRKTGIYNAIPMTPEEFCSYPGILLSAQEGSTGVVDIPFVNNKRFIDLNSYAENELAQVQGMVLNNLQNIQGETNEVKVVVTARFLNAEVFMPRTTAQSQRGASFHRPMHSRQRRRNPPNKESLQKSENGAISEVFEIAEDLTNVIGTIFLGESAMNSIRNLQVRCMDKPQSVESGITKIAPFSDVAQSKGLDKSVVLAQSQETRISTEPNVAGFEFDEMYIPRILRTPSLLQTIEFTAATPAQCLSNCTAVDIANSFPICDHVIRAFSLVCGSYYYKLYITASQFHSIRMAIWLDDGYQWDKGGTQVSPPVSNFQECFHQIIDIQGDTEVAFAVPYMNRLPMTYPENISGDFKLYAGILSWVPNSTIPNSIFVNVFKAAAEDFHFTGQKSISFILQSERNISFTENGVQVTKCATCGSVFTQSTEPLVAQTRTRVTTDVENCTQRKKVRVIRQSNPRADFNAPFNMIHDQLSGYQTKNLCSGEDFESIRDLIHRYYPYGGISPGYEREPYDLTGATTNRTHLEYWGEIFAFFRGSCNVKLISKNPHVIQSVRLVDLRNQELYGTNISCEPNPVLEFNVPNINRFLFNSTSTGDGQITRQLAYSYGGTQNTDGSNRWLLEAAGDDFSFHFIIPPCYTATGGYDVLPPPGGFEAFSDYLAPNGPMLVRIDPAYTSTVTVAP